MGDLNITGTTPHVLPNVDDHVFLQSNHKFNLLNV
jgi:hypothetical protein